MNKGSGRQNGGVPCEAVREALPELVAASSGRFPVPEVPGAASLAAHLDSCGPCSEERDFLQRLAHARPSPPDTLAATIVARALTRAGSSSDLLEQGSDAEVITFRRPAHRPSPGPWWATSSAAAAVLVLAAGLGLVARGGPGGSAVPTAPPEMLVAVDAELSLGWPEEWIVAGAPYLDAVSDETLAVLAAAVEP